MRSLAVRAAETCEQPCREGNQINQSGSERLAGGTGVSEILFPVESR